MKIKTGEIADKSKDKDVVSSIKLSKGTRVGTLKLTVNGDEQSVVRIGTRTGGSSSGSTDIAELWKAINNKVDVDFFNRLFTVYDSSGLEIATNTYTQTPDNLEISVGTWTEEYLSALGKNSEGGGGGGGTGTVTGIAVGIGSTPIYPDYETGIVTIPAYPTRVSQLTNDSGYITNSYLSNNYYTKTDADSKFMTIAAFERVFNILDENGTKINHPYSSGIDSIKALVGLWTEEYLSALGQNSEGGSSGGGSVNAIKVGTNPDTYLDPVEGIIDMSNYVTTAAQRTLWTNSAHTHSNKAVLDNITAGQVAAWNNVAAIMGEDQDNIINKWNEVVAFLSTYTEADTLANLLSNKLDVEFFRRIFTVYDEDGNIIVPNTYTQVADNLKILVGAWTEEYLSALGKNNEGGGGGTGDVSHIKISSNPDVYLDPVDGIIDMSSYAATWNAKANSATTLAGYGITDAKITNGTTITLGNSSITPLTANSSLSWSKLTETPTTLAGYGIGDVKISNGVITLGSSTITPVTSVAMTVPTGFSVSGSPISKTGTLALAYATGYEGFTTALKEKIEALYSWFEVDANGDVKTKDTAGGHVRGFYTESFVSALGANSQGGGSSTFDEAQMWTALQSTSGTYATTKIATSHIPDMASTYGYLKSSALSGYATQSWVNQQGFLTTHQTLYTLSIYGGTTKVLDFKPNANASIYIKAGGDISLTNDTTNKYITLSYTHPTNGANTTISAASGKVLSAITVNSLGHVTSVSSKTLASADIPDISATYASASRATTLEGYFNSGGVAKVAAKLNTGTTTYSAWGQTYWSSGVPQSISGNMTSVGSITPSANGNALGTTSARFNIYGTAGNFSGNVSITGTLGVTGATTLTGLLTANGNIKTGTSNGAYIQIGAIKLVYDSTNNALKVIKSDDSSANFYATGAVSALGANSSGGGSGTFDEEAMWEALGTTSTAKVIASSHIPNLSASKITSGTFAAARIPIATASAVGGIKVGTTLAISDGVLNQKSGIATAGTYRSVTVDTYGRVTAGTNPTTLSGYGILDAYTKTQVDNALSGYLPLSGGTLTGTLTAPKIRINTRHSSGNTSGGIYYYDGTTDYLLIGQGSANLWIGANETDGTHHTGSTYISAGTGNVNVSRLVNGSRLNYMVLDTGNYSSYALPLTGGTLTGGLTALGYNVKFDVDTSREIGLAWLNTSDTKVASVTYHNTAQNIILNPVGSSNTWSDAVGKYSLIVGNNKLTYNTYTILHSNNTYVSSGKGYINGTAITNLSHLSLVSGGTLDSTAGSFAWSSGSIIYSGNDNVGIQIGDSVDKWQLTGDSHLHFRQNDSGGTNSANWGNWLQILDTGNYSSYALPLSGGTITGNLAVRGYIYLRDNNKGLYTTDTADNVQNTLYLNNSNQLLIGYGTAGSGYNTYIYGNNLYLRYGTSRTIGITLSSSGSTTFAGAIVAKENAYSYYTDATSYGLYMNNSDIAGVNSIYTSDTSGNWTEGIHFIRSNNNWDTFRALDGVFYFGANNSNSTGTEDITIDAGTRKILIGGTTTSTMTYNTTNPRLVFAENGDTQAVGIVYTDFNDYRAGKGLKVMDVDQNDPTVWFEVGGSIYATGDVQASSDARKKNIISNTKFNVKDIASARSILYEWNDGRDSGQVHGGSIAQDWIGKADSFLSQDGEGWYSINYGALALCSAITIAREVLKHEDRITLLEKENARLKARVEELEERRIA